MKHKIMLCAFACGLSAECMAVDLPEAKELHGLAIADTAIPIAPGRIDGAPFWNQYAVRFIS